jgi:hypothetical protein
MLRIVATQVISDLVHFWLRNVVTSWRIGYGIFAAIEALSVIGAAILRFRVGSLRRERWEDFTMKAAIILLAASFIISTLFVAPFVQYQEAKRSHIVGANEPESTQKRQVADALAKVLDEGVELEGRFFTKDFPRKEDNEKWAREVTKVLESPELGAGYLSRFNSSDSVIGLEGTSISGHTDEESNRWQWVRKRNGTLREFIKELSTR